MSTMTRRLSKLEAQCPAIPDPRLAAVNAAMGTLSLDELRLLARCDQDLAGDEAAEAERIIAKIEALVDSRA